MPLVKPTIRPGIVKDLTEYAAGSGPYWADGDKVRFRNGRPRKIGGWAKEANWQFTGVPRSIKVWSDLSNNSCIAVGTHAKLQLIYNDELYDITPIRAESDPMGADPFETVNGSAVVQVTDAAHGALENDYVIFSGAAAVGGITVSGEYVVQEVIDANTYTIEHSESATSDATGGGASVVAKYLVHTGFADSVLGFGWGAGAYGEGTYGTPRDETSGAVATPTFWSLDTWGEDLVATRLNGETSIWDASAGPTVRAAVSTDIPDPSFITFVSIPDRHLVALGAYNGSAQDPLLVRWSSQENYTDWTPSATNTAGDQRLHLGSRIVGYSRSSGQMVIFTDAALFSMYFQGPPFTFGFQPIGTNCGLIAPNAVIDRNGIMYWMGCGNFYAFDGTLRLLPCPVLDHVFNDINPNVTSKIFAALNKKFQEVWWFYPSANSSEPDKYVIYNYLTNDWSIGTMDNRTAWTDRSLFLRAPIGLSSDGSVYYHEFGLNADDQPLGAFVESSSLEMDAQDAPAGTRLVHIDRIVPDASITGFMKVEIKSRKHPAGEETTKGPFTVAPDSDKISVRVRGRQFALRYSCSDLGDDFELGDFRFNILPDSER